MVETDKPKGESEVKAKPVEKSVKPFKPDFKKPVKVKTLKTLNCSKGKIEKGKTTELPEMEVRRLAKFLERV